MIIKEIIVVEGKSDTMAINNAVNADTIETNGSAVNRMIIEAVRHAKEKRGVIIFTDPDFPGEKIRKTISESVPGCKHAFLTREEAAGLVTQSLGIEHASPEAIRDALAKVYTETSETEEHISMTKLRENGLVGGKGARERREKLGEHLKIGYTNAKQLHKRLKMFQITEDDFNKALKAVILEEVNE
ncbi:RNAse M5 [Scopulibacillus darangshiensis]|uniref:Ribonuclease M5 n=1 Tax=Scopulibacillus darangshiensis TaxID=442528 RepID=A0A4V2SLA3_9BACL|nr:ribonuclease M5 [Scopulibacillus darangshiensis]TCP22556.1 RNAse M5 [Scopulibacillus darangshiensis]